MQYSTVEGEISDSTLLYCAEFAAASKAYPGAQARRCLVFEPTDEQVRRGIYCSIEYYRPLHVLYLIAENASQLVCSRERDTVLFCTPSACADRIPRGAGPEPRAPPSQPRAARPRYTRGQPPGRPLRDPPGPNRGRGPGLCGGDPDGAGELGAARGPRGGAHDHAPRPPPPAHEDVSTVLVLYWYGHVRSCIIDGVQNGITEGGALVIARCHVCATVLFRSPLVLQPAKAKKKRMAPKQRMSQVTVTVPFYSTVLHCTVLLPLVVPQPAKAKKKRMARLQKAIGDFCLLAGSPRTRTRTSRRPSTSQKQGGFFVACRGAGGTLAPLW